MGEEEEMRLNDKNPDLILTHQTPSLDALPLDTGNKDKSMDAQSNNKKSWMTPKWLLLVFCVINLLNYIDRGAIASNGINSNIKNNFKLSNYQDGFISSAFMIGLLVASPIFASLAKSVNPFRLIGVGLTVWTLAVALCGFSNGYGFLIACRMFVGVGEACFISLAPPFIDDNAPPAQRTVWLGAFYMCIPLGIAVGYVYGGVVGGLTLSSWCLSGWCLYGWRVAFWLEAVLMLPFVIMGFTMKPLNMKGFAPAKSTIAAASPEDDLQNKGSEPSKRLEVAGDNAKPSGFGVVKVFFKDMKYLLSEKVWVVNVLGYIAYNFVIGAYSYWGPTAGGAIYAMKNADYMFGGVTAVCGILGTLAGGFILDHITSTLSNAFKLLSLSTLLGGAVCFGAFCLRHQYPYLALFAVGQLLVFATQAPVNFVCLHSVKPSLRPLSMSMSTVAIHVLGDVPSAPLVGLLQDRIHNWRKTALALTSILFLAAIIWFIGIFMHSVDRYNDESDSSIPVSTEPENMNAAPLQEEKKAETV